MLKQKLHQACKEQGINNAAELCRRLEGTSAELKYNVVLGLWNEVGKVSNLVAVYKELGVKI